MPPFEVSPTWLNWSDDRRTLDVAEAPNPPEELAAWRAPVDKGLLINKWTIIACAGRNTKRL
jgi:hypothetical protein